MSEINKISYNLVIDDYLSEFKNEIEYVFDFVDEYYNTYRDKLSTNVVYYGKEKSLSKYETKIKSSGFWELLKIEKDGIHLYPSKYDSLDGIIVLKKQKDTDTDYISTIFFLLSRIEERDVIHKDKYKRFRSIDSFLVRNGREKSAVADMCSLELAKLIRHDDNPKHTSSFEFIPTHDVDRLRAYHYFFEPIRYFLGDIFKRKISINKAFHRISSTYFSGEPFKQFRFLMDVSEKKNIKSRFFFMGLSEHYMDSTYTLRYKKLLRRVVSEVVDRGHIIGFHPGYLTYNDRKQWGKQKKSIEKEIGSALYIGRQHVLRYDVSTTPGIWDKYNMKCDYTLTLPDMIGLRSGTTREHNSYDLQSRKKLNLRQVNTVVMDAGIFGGKYNDYDLDYAISETNTVIDEGKKYGGKCCILIHPGNMTDKKMKYYESIIGE